MTIKQLHELLHAADPTITLDAVVAEAASVNYAGNFLTERTVISHASADAIATALSVETY